MNRAAHNSLVVLAWCIGLHVFFWLMMPMGHGKLNARRAACQSNLKYIALAARHYQSDHDALLPPLSAGPSTSWAPALRTKMRDTRAFSCPANGVKYIAAWQPSRGILATDYFYNARLAGRENAELKQPQNIIAFGDGAPLCAVSCHASTLPRAWMQNGNSPARRHLDGANYAFADGHVKWFKPERIKEVPPDKNQPTFSIR